MAEKHSSRTLLIFYSLVIFVLAFFAWWIYLLLDYNEQISRLSDEITDEKHLRRIIMIVSEGLVFLALLLWGAWRIQRSFKKEIELGQRQRNFLLSITHELKSPLASLKLAMQTLKRKKAEKSQKEKLLDNSATDIERLEVLVENLLFAAKLENRVYEYQFKDLDLSELTKKMAEKIKSDTSENREWEIEVEQSIKIKGDKPPLQSLLVNLIENAVKYSSENDQISVRLLKENAHAVLKIADTGKGVPDSMKEKIFQKFYRMGNEDIRDTKGTGLGLFIVKRVADAHHAEVKVKNNLPDGTIFIIKFPVE